MTPAFIKDSDSFGMDALSLLLVGPQDERRRSIAAALAGPQAIVTAELSFYPRVDDIAAALEAGYDAVVVDLDPDPEQALDVIENICAENGNAIVMAYSARADSELLMRCMRAGAREFLSEPLRPNTVTESLVRAAVRRDELQRNRKTVGKLLVFAGVKGGCGVTTVAANVAVALALQEGEKVALVDLDLRLGDAALTLGLTPSYSAVDALENTNRLDSHFLSALLAKHNSGLSVLAASDGMRESTITKSALQKLLRVVRGEFSYVVIDAGSQPQEHCELLFEAATTVYLVTQVGVAELRNANRWISGYFSGPESGKLEVVLNRHQAKGSEIDDAAIAKALTRLPKWKIPNDFAAVRQAQNTGVPMVQESREIARTFDAMASAVLGRSAKPAKKKFGLFG